MKFLRSLLLLLCFASPAWAVETVADYGRRFADSEMARFPEAWQLDHGSRLYFGYSQGVGCCAMLKMWKATGDEKYYRYVEHWADSLIAADGTIHLYTPESYNLDFINSGKVLFDLYRQTHDKKYRKAMDGLIKQLKNQPRTCDGGYWHKLIYPHQMWLDGIYMASPFMAQYGAEFDKPEWIAEAVKQVTLCHDHKAKVYYQTCADLMFEVLNDVISDTSRDYYYLPTAATPGNYARLWDNPEPHAREVVCAIIYDYQRNQTNKLLHHFSSEYPNKYMLRPCMDVVTNRLENNDFNPGWSADKRTTVICAGRGGKPFLAKYRPIGSTRRPDAFQDDVHIYLFRATEYHFFLMEALNGLGRFSAADALLNAGIKADFFEKDADGNMVKDEDGYGTPIAGFEGFTNDWSAQASWGTRKYPHMGIRGCFGITSRPFNLSSAIAADGSNLMELMEENDMAILDECLLEFAGEGKVYPTMIRMAKRWGDGDYKRSVVSDRVCLKYGEKADEMRPKIESQIFVPWDLKLR